MNDEYYCKLLDQTVELGVCMDINFERERLFMADTLIKLNWGSFYKAKEGLRDGYSNCFRFCARSA